VALPRRKRDPEIVDRQDVSLLSHAQFSGLWETRVSNFMASTTEID
jgi:hypothetical protein